MTADPATAYRAVTPGQGRTRRPRPQPLPAPLFPVWLPPHRTMRESWRLSVDCHDGVHFDCARADCCCACHPVVTAADMRARRHPHGRAGRLYCDGHP